MSTQSEFLPGAWFVLEPSKPQIGRSSPSAMILVLERRRAVGSVPSIQMYSALKVTRALLRSSLSVAPTRLVAGRAPRHAREPLRHRISRPLPEHERSVPGRTAAGGMPYGAQPSVDCPPCSRQLDYVLRTVEERGVRFVRLWFTDVLGSLKSFAITPAELETALEEGMTFDGSAIQGYSRVQESDMLAMPDPSTFEIVPWRGRTPPSPACSATSSTSRASRSTAIRATCCKRNLERARDKGFTFYTAPEIEFFYLRVRGLPAGPARQRRLLRPHRAGHGERAAPPDHPHARGHGHPGRVQLPRARTEPARDRPALHRRAVDGRQRDDVPPWS